MQNIYVILLWALVMSMIEAKSSFRGSHIMEHKSQMNHDYSSGSKKGNPLFDFLFGFFLFFAAMPILWYNERRHLINQFRIETAKKDCQEVQCSEIDPRNNGKLIHTSGKSDTNQLITDQEFGVSEAKVMKLSRVVEMFQWIEHSHTRDNRTYYTYSTDWSSTFHDSRHYSEYGHTNDESKWIVKAQDFINNQVSLGAFNLSESLIKQTNNTTSININAENSRLANQRYQGRGFQNIIDQGKFIAFKQQFNTDTPGDLRVSFLKVDCEDVTVVSQQTGNTFQPYVFHDKFEKTVNESLEDTDVSGCCCGLCKAIKKWEAPITDIDWIFERLYNKHQSFNEKLGQSQLQTTLVRFAGWILMALGVVLIFSPITYLVSWIPFLGNFLASITTIIFWIVGFAVATPVAILTISVAWLYYRPKIGIMLVALGLLIGFGIWYYIAHSSQ
ncbi:Transmembrane protein 43 [Paramecium bursaria]